MSTFSYIPFNNLNQVPLHAKKMSKKLTIAFAIANHELYIYYWNI